MNLRRIIAGAQYALMGPLTFALWSFKVEMPSAPESKPISVMA
jgi:hypothetical protein